MIDGDTLDRELLALRGRGLSYTALAVVSDYCYGWRLTSEQIRKRMRKLGAPRDARWDQCRKKTIA